MQFENDFSYLFCAVQDSFGTKLSNVKRASAAKTIIVVEDV